VGRERSSGGSAAPPTARPARTDAIYLGGFAALILTSGKGLPDPPTAGAGPARGRFSVVEDRKLLEKGFGLRMSTAAAFLPVKKSPARKRKNKERILVLETDEGLLSSILTVLQQVAPEAVVDVARDAEEAERISADSPVELVVLDLDAAPEVISDLRARHPMVPTILLAAEDADVGMDGVHLLKKPFADSDFMDLAQSLLHPGKDAPPRKRILVVDDSLMLLSFVEDFLKEANYEVVTAGTAQEGIQATLQQKPDLILLDYLLPDLRGDEVSERLSANKSTADIPVLFMSGFGADLENVQDRSENVLGILRKPFTTDALLKAVQENLSKMPSEEDVEPAVDAELANAAGPEPEETPAVDTLWDEPASAVPQTDEQPQSITSDFGTQSQPALFDSGLAENIYFSGDTAFFSFSRALRVIGQEKLTGTLRSAGAREPVELYASDGKVVLVTTRDAEAYCAEAPVTLVNIDPDRVREAREAQSQTGCPLFITLAREDLILREPALQLVQHYGQKLFAQQWSASRVRFAFQAGDIPDFTRDIPADDDIEHWMLGTLRFVQIQDIAEKANYDPAWIPAYTRDGFERVQKLRLTVAEAQFASQFNGARSVAQIARNLRLDLRFARLTLFRFVELEIVECWPPGASDKAERGGVFKRLLGRINE
jgi:DNA-binding response OmpR family regulator